SLDAVAQRKYGGGTGEPNDPYQIATAEDLMLLGDTPEDYDKHFIMIDDIDLDPNLPGRKVFDGAVIAPDVNDATWWFDGTSFNGVFDGNNHIISNLNIKGKSFLGLFGTLSSRATITNLCLDAVYVNGIGSYVGGLAGLNTGTITTSYSTGSVSGEMNVGGLVGANGYPGDYTFYGGTIHGCYSTGDTAGVENVGGLVGRNPGDVQQSFSTSFVNGVEAIGGLVGRGSGTIENCYCSGNVTGEKQVGGLVGNAWDSVPSEGGFGYSYGGTISFCYSTSFVTGVDFVGGLVGNIWNFFYPEMSCLEFAVNSFWDIEISGQTKMCGSGNDETSSKYGQTTTEMLTATTFLEAGWDFVNETENGTEDIWKISKGLDYPRLWWEKYSGGTGDPNNPYRVATAEDLIILGESPEDYDKHFILIADIDLDPNLPGRKAFDRAVIAPDVNSVEDGFQGTPFTGVFDGRNYLITNLTIEGGSYLGLFGKLGDVGKLDEGAEILNLGLSAISVNGVGMYISGLVGHNHGSITKSYNIGTVNGVQGVGGLVGFNTGRITASYSIGTITGDLEIGGLVGENWGSITASYSTGEVRGDVDTGGLVGENKGPIDKSYSTCVVIGNLVVGGLVGDNKNDAQHEVARWPYGNFAGTIDNCYSTGPVTGNDYVGGLVGSNSDFVGGSSNIFVRECFWDIETSGQNASVGGTGKTTAEMQTAGTFLEADWDFVDETENGTEDIWWILEGQDYPGLWWELIEENSVVVPEN
ncbi:MAG: hypothetical protein ACYS3N_10615, partial [Planctomycetota bacterium]